MKSVDDIKSTLSAHKERLAKEYSIKTLAIFGSYSRNEQNTNSDLDILVEFDGSIGIRFIDLANELEDILSSKVDLVSKNGLKQKYFNLISNELIYV